jgi:hypothetical protein
MGDKEEVGRLLPTKAADHALADALALRGDSAVLSGLQVFRRNSGD